MWYPKGFKLKIGFTLSDFHIFFHTHPTLKKTPFAKCVKSLFQEHIEIHLFNLQGVGPHGKILRRWCWDSHLLFPTYAFSFLKKFPHICLSFFPISPKFSVRTNLFWFNLHLCIWKTLKPSSWKCPKISLVHWQVFHPISNGEISLVSAKVIILTTYLRGLSPQSSHACFCKMVAQFY